MKEELFKKSYELTRYCFECGKQFKIIKYLNIYHIDVFCSTKCHDKHKAELYKKGKEIRMNNKWNDFK